MKLNKNSWHYWLFDKSFTIFGGDTPFASNLCQYMRRLFFMMVMPLAFVLLQVFSFYYHWYSVFGIEGMFLAILAATAVIIGGAIFTGDHWEGVKSSLVVQWVAAKKNKVCPIIEFTEE